MLSLSGLMPMTTMMCRSAIAAEIQRAGTARPESITDRTIRLAKADRTNTTGGYASAIETAMRREHAMRKTEATIWQTDEGREILRTDKNGRVDVLLASSNAADASELAKALIDWLGSGAEGRDVAEYAAERTKSTATK